MHNFCEVTSEELAQWLEANDEKSYLNQQLLGWVYQKSVTDWEQMSNIGKELRQKLARAFRLPALKLEKVVDSNDGETYKFLWQLIDGSFVESVLIISGDRRTVCVSSQVGCPARCAFCASGSRDSCAICVLPRSSNRWCRLTSGSLQRMSGSPTWSTWEWVSPFENYDAVMQSIQQLIDPEMLEYLPAEDHRLHCWRGRGD